MKDFLNKYLEKYEIEKKKTLNERQELLKELYDFYLKHQKISNWKTYRKNFREDNKKNIDLFMKSKDYYKPMDIKLFCIRIGHIPTQDIYYLISIARDMLNRKTNFNKWLFYNLKANDK